MNLYLVTNDILDITAFVTSATLSGDYRSVSRTLDFGIIQSSNDPNIPKLVLKLGDKIQLVESGKVLFHGIVWERSRATDGTEISFMARDFGVYLNKNKGTYNFKNATPEAIATKVCKDFGIEVGDVAKTGVPISRKFFANTLYEIIMTAYSMASDKKYHCIFVGKKFFVMEKGILAAKDINLSNLMTSSMSESLEEMTNKVDIYSKNEKFIKSLKNHKDIEMYGVLGDFYKIRGKENYNAQAKKKLQGVSSKITVTNFGDVSYIAGRKVKYEDPFSKAAGFFYIDDDQHRWKNGIYSNKLTLNFENLMDEKESGSEK